MFKFNLRNKLIIFSMCLLIPLTLFAYYLIRENANYTQSQIVNSTTGVGEIVQSDADIFLNDTKNLLLMLAQNPALRNLNQRETMSTFIEVMHLEPSILNIYAAHADGKVFADSVWRGEDSLDISNRDEFRAALASGQPSLSKRIISRATGQMAISVMVPIVNNMGQSIGVIGADISVKDLQNSFNDADKKRITSIAITDENGVVLVHSDYRYVYEETNLSDLLPFTLASQGKSGIVKYNDPSGNPMWAAYLPTKSFPGTVLVFLPETAIQPPVRATTIRWFAALITVIIFVISLSVFFARRTTKPIQELVDATNKIISRENSRQKVTITSKDELGELARAFNTMSEGLADYIEKLAAANIQIAKNEQELRWLLSHLVKAQEEERSRIAADIHDGVIQMIVGALFEVTAALNLMEKDPETSVNNLHNSMDLLSKTVTEMQRVIFNLRPPILEDLGLVPALKLQSSMNQSIYHIPINLSVQGEIVKMDPIIEVIIYRIVQEGIGNSIKHSGASSIDIDIIFNEQTLNIAINDNGCGFDALHPPENTTGGFGLIAMKERAASIGAQLKVDSQIDSGTNIFLEISLQNSKGGPSADE